MMRQSRALLASLCLLLVWIPRLQGNDYPPEKTRKIIERQAFPWYDKATGQFLPVDSPAPQVTVRKISDQGGTFADGLPRVIFWAALIIGTGALIVLVVRHGLPAIEKDQESPVQEESRQEADRLEALPQVVRNSGDLLKRAMELYANGLPGEAILFFHSWQLLQLDKMGKIELQKGKTNRQYLFELTGAKAELVETFRESTRLFEDAYFGALQVSGERFANVWDRRAVFAETSSKSAVRP